MSNIKVGIVGLGVVGKRLLDQFHESPNIEVAALCDQNKELLKQTAVEYEIDFYTTNYQEVVSHQDIQLIYIAVPPAFHFEVVMAALEQKKHVLCEKPLANSGTEAEMMNKKAEEVGVVHAMHFPLPYQSAIATMKEAIKDPSFGTVKQISLKMHFEKWPRVWQQTPWINTREQGGFVREIMPHYLQLVFSLFGEIEKVKGEIEFPPNEVESEIGLSATLTLKSGIDVVVDGLVGAEEEKILFTIHGTEQTIALEDWRVLKRAFKNEDLETVSLSEMKASETTIINELTKAIHGQEAFLIDFQSGMKVQSVLEDILRLPNLN
ncbi:Gfo/Idh/MocA family oxidoreductase [Alkalihalobacillus sp. MEB130]|uniref:Gfo/Idh/MocA family protein n=1 Tax=Alkalihalobacillus sp. MEB130 TaxID=2976704 RepID=UPI0028E09917|nr:Gfo/Idh/MocA family oxidoreductase [Alkalihalobacillus sp. MEB130]MDT8860891.1 Gfo/Idh/MocA family oxidoreductase [Alkalihalobacillus sp. MEB130]